MAKPLTYTMKWNNYKNHISGTLVQLLESESMVDLTLCAEGEKISCHRIILSACSPYFQEILAEIDSSNAVVILCGISADDIRSIIEFVYKGELHVSSEKFSSFLRAAESLKITGLMEVNNHLTKSEPVTFKDDSTSQDTEENDIECITPVKQELLSAEDDTLNPRNIVEIADESDFNEDDNGASYAVITDENEGHSDYSLQIPATARVPQKRKKRKPKRQFSKRDYSEDALSAALDDLVQGNSLVETANAHHIPRSTLYARARNYGIIPTIARHEYSEEKLAAAVETVRNGASLQSAAVTYGIPKTVVWRRVQKDIGTYALSRRAKLRQRYLPHTKEEAIRALESGENINKVSSMFKIPKTTLFRYKSRLVEAGKLPPSCLKRRGAYNDSYKQLRLRQAVEACREGRMSQALASSTFKVSKTTIWRRLRQGSGKKQLKFEESSEKSEDVEKVENFEQIVSEIPVTYSEENPYTEASFIILAPDSEITGDYQTAEQVMVDNVLVAESIEDVGEIIEIQETQESVTYVDVEELPAGQSEECS